MLIEIVFFIFLQPGNRQLAFSIALRHLLLCALHSTYGCKILWNVGPKEALIPVRLASLPSLTDKLDQFSTFIVRMFIYNFVCCISRETTVVDIKKAKCHFLSVSYTIPT